ncbi:MAG: hypothetical protein AVDCRST_MAG89-3428, partial [uncultured Gemmatimonadetes bacterium]
ELQCVVRYRGLDRGRRISRPSRRLRGGGGGGGAPFRHPRALGGVVRGDRGWKLVPLPGARRIHRALRPRVDVLAHRRAGGAHGGQRGGHRPQPLAAAAGQHPRPARARGARLHPRVPGDGRGDLHRERHAL